MTIVAYHTKQAVAQQDSRYAEVSVPELCLGSGTIVTHRTVSMRMDEGLDSRLRQLDQPEGMVCAGILSTWAVVQRHKNSRIRSGGSGRPSRKPCMKRHPNARNAST